VKVAILIQELGSNGNGGRNKKAPYHVSLRSDGTVDVSAIASAFGGGGHISAAGFNTNATLSDLKSQILKMTESI
jgi:phosphoesterase RecJ-like protein